MNSMTNRHSLPSSLSFNHRSTVQRKHTFVKYNNPIVINDGEDSKDTSGNDNTNDEKKGIVSNKYIEEETGEQKDSYGRNDDKSEESNKPKKTTVNHKNCSSSSRTSQTPFDISTRTKNILQFMFPPKSWRCPKENKRYVQHVSRTPATSSDVLRLRHSLNEKLSLLQKQQNQNQKQGRNNILQTNEKEELYNACFDELIRQSTVENVERGLLYHKIKNELQGNIKTLKTLYVSSVTFGVQKAISARREKEELMLLVEQLRNENDILNSKVQELMEQIEEIEKQKEVDESSGMVEGERGHFDENNNNNIQSKLTTEEEKKKELWNKSLDDDNHKEKIFSLQQFGGGENYALKQCA